MAQQREEDENEVSGGERQGGKGQRESNLLKVEQGEGEMMREQEVGIRRKERKGNGNRKERTDCGKCKAKRGGDE